MSRECPDRKVEVFESFRKFLSDLVDFTEGSRSKECSNSLVSDSIVLAGLARSVCSKVALEADV